MQNRNLEMLERVDSLNKLAVTRGFTIKANECFKNNTSKMGYSLVTEDTSAAPTVYFSSLEEYWDSDEKIVDYLEHVLENNKLNTELINKFTSREHILSNVKAKVVSNTNLEHVLENGIVYMNYLDMLILFYVEISDLSDANGSASYTIKNAHLESLHIGMDELYHNAISNVEDDFEIRTMSSIIMEMMGIPEGDEDFELPEGDYPMWIVTNKKRFNGAAAILSEKNLKRIEEKVGKEFAILPSSIHEIIAIPFGARDASDLKKMVCEVNESEVEPEDKLTDSVYLYKDGHLKEYE